MRALLAAAAFALATATVPAAAAPDVQQVLYGYADVYVQGSDRVLYRVIVQANVVAGVATTAKSSVALFVAKCAPTCGTPVYYGAPLTAAQYDARDEQRWWVRLTAFGKPLTVTWTGLGITGAKPPNGFVFSPVAFAAGVDWPATAAVTVLGRTCTTKDATAGRAVVVHTFGRGDPAGFPARSPKGVPASARACKPRPA